MHEHFRAALTQLIQDEVRVALQRSRRTAGPASAVLLAEWISCTFVLVLNWWVESESPHSAREADALFRRLVEPSLAELLG